MSKFEHVFIVTYGRSGSTLLQRILNSIEGYNIKGENANALYGLYLSYKRSLEAKNHKNNSHSDKHPWYGANQINPIKYGRRICNVFRREFLNPKLHDRVVGFKEIRYFNHQNNFQDYLKFIEMFFDNSCFIFNKRDVAEVKNSGWWRKKDPEEVEKLISAADRLMDNYNRNNPQNSYIVHYNTYTKNPDTLKGLFDFLGESFNQDAINFILSKKLNHCKK